MKREELINGKKVVVHTESGCILNPLPRTERGWRRRKANYPPNGVIPKGHPGWNANHDGQSAPSEPKAE